MTDHDHQQVMRNLVLADEHIRQARELVGDCFINRLPKDDPLSAVAESIWNVLYRGGDYRPDALNTDGCLDLLMLAARAVQPVPGCPECMENAVGEICDECRRINEEDAWGADNGEVEP